MVPPKNVIPIPSVAEVRQLPEIPAHTDVLALYPGTTCFYNAIVITPPSKVYTVDDVLTFNKDLPLTFPITFICLE